MSASTASYLRVMRRVLERDIASELTSDAAKRAAHILLGSFDELLKREITTPAVHAAAIPRGIQAALNLASRLTVAAVPVDPSALECLHRLHRDHTTRLAPSQLQEDCAALDSVIESMMQPVLTKVMNGNDNARALAELLRETAEWKQSLAIQQLIPTPPDTADTGIQPLTRERLQDFVKACLPDDPNIKILDFLAVSGGMSKQTFRFKLQHGNGAVEQLIVRKAPPVPFLDVSCFYLHREFDFVRCLFQQGYPVPEPLWLARSFPGVGGDFYVMRQITGENSGGLFSTVDIPETILLEMAEALARLHRIPLEAFHPFIEKHGNLEILRENAGESTRRYLLNLITSWRQVTRGTDCGEVFILTWALANVPPNAGRVVPLHGDFTPHNCLWRDEHLVAVLDWECGDFGDPAIDLAYVKSHIASRMSWEKFVSHYETHLGRTVDTSRLAYYSVLLDIRSWVSCNVVSGRIDARQTDDVVALNIDYQYAPMYINACIDRTRQ